jgi:hypothetical protein
VALDHVADADLDADFVPTPLGSVDGSPLPVDGDEGTPGPALHIDADTIQAIVMMDLQRTFGGNVDVLDPEEVFGPAVVAAVRAQQTRESPLPPARAPVAIPASLKRLPAREGRAQGLPLRLGAPMLVAMMARADEWLAAGPAVWYPEFSVRSKSGVGWGWGGGGPGWARGGSGRGEGGGVGLCVCGGGGLG